MVSTLVIANVQGMCDGRCDWFLLNIFAEHRPNIGNNSRLAIDAILVALENYRLRDALENCDVEQIFENAA